MKIFCSTYCTALDDDHRVHGNCADMSLLASSLYLLKLYCKQKPRPNIRPNCTQQKEYVA